MSSPDGVLKVNPDVLRQVGTSFNQAGDAIAGIHADAPLGEAGSAVPQLATGDACRKAQGEIATEMTALSNGARNYGDNLNTAAHQYQTRDQASAAAIKKVEFPK